MDLVLVSTAAHSTMLLVENRHRVFDPTAKYIRYRRELVDWFFEAREQFRLTSVTCHVALGYLDRVLHAVAVSRSRLHLVACCCLMIAAKYEEAETRVPCVAVLSDFVGGVYTTQDINHTEVLVLQKMGWACTVVTPMHFLGHFAAWGLLFGDDSRLGRPLLPASPRDVRMYAEFFADMCVQEYQLTRFRPSVLAAALVLAARRALSICPTWNPALAPVLGYSFEDVKVCLDEVWLCYSLKYPEQVAALEFLILPFRAAGNLLPAAACSGLLSPFVVSEPEPAEAEAETAPAALTTPGHRSGIRPATLEPSPSSIAQL